MSRTPYSPELREKIAKEYLEGKYEILLGQLHQITKKAHLKGIEV